MKKFLSIILCAAFLLGMLVFSGCGKTEASLKLGLGIYTSVKTSDATEDKNGQGQATVTGAAVLVDDKGKIVQCVLDCADNTVSYTADGKALAKDSFATKYEQGAAYGR